MFAMIWMPVDHRAGKSVMRAQGKVNLLLNTSEKMRQRCALVDRQDRTRAESRAPIGDANALRETTSSPTVCPADTKSQVTARCVVI